MSDPTRDDLSPEERALLARAAGGAPPPPEPHWGAYRVQLRARLDARRAGRAGARRWWAQPAAIAVSAGLATALLLFAVQPTGRPPTNGDIASVDDAIIGARLDLFEHYRLVERLDLLEDLEVIRQLEGGPARDG
jgi:hypothetical protein